MACRRSQEDGLTFIELLVAVVVLGTGFLTVLAGLSTTMRTTGLHERQSRGEAIVREFAEAIDAASYRECGAPADYAAAYAAPSGWTAAVVGVSYWDADVNQFTATCTHSGVEQVSLQVAHDDVTESVEIVKRTP